MQDMYCRTEQLRRLSGMAVQVLSVGRLGLQYERGSCRRHIVYVSLPFW